MIISAISWTFIVLFVVIAAAVRPNYIEPTPVSHKLLDNNDNELIDVYSIGAGSAHTQSKKG